MGNMPKTDNVAGRGTAAREEIFHSPGSVISCRGFRYRFFPRPLHYHEEIELLLITEGRGRLWAGGGMAEFAPGDLALFGAGLPHFYMSGEEYYSPGSQLWCASEALQFSEGILPRDMERIGELSPLQQLMEDCARGVVFTVPPRMESVRRMIAHIDGLSGIRRITSLLRMLDILARNYPYRLLSPEGAGIRGRDPRSPTGAISGYIERNFREQVTLGGMASELGMNPAAMCRCFRKNTGKTIFEVLNATRIGFACQLLIHSDLTVSQVAYDSGFRTVSHFNHVFAAVIKLTPTQYRALNALPLL